MIIKVMHTYSVSYIIINTYANRFLDNTFQIIYIS